MNLEPDDPLEPIIKKIDVCKNCGNYIGNCKCENSPGTVEQLGFECPDCHEIFTDEDDWLSHNGCEYDPYWYLE